MLISGLGLFVTLVSLHVQKNASFKFESNPDYVIFGSSISTYAYNDSIIENFKNLSDLGEPYFYTYYKVKEVIRQNRSLKAIFIEFSNGNIDKDKMQGRVWDDENMRYRYPELASFIPFEEQMFLFRNNFQTYLDLQRVSSRINMKKILKDDYDFTDKIGSYRWINRNKTDSLLAAISYDEVELLDASSKYEISKIDLFWLDKIVNLCEENGVRLILIRTPIHRLYALKKNESFYQQIRKKRYGDVDYLDLSGMEFATLEYADFEHLNYKGATKYSHWFNNLLNSGLLNGKIMHDSINKEIKVFNNHLEK